MSTTAVPRSARFVRCLGMALAAVLAWAAAQAGIARAMEIPSSGLEFDRVSLDWKGNGEIQKAPYFGGSNYLSAGLSEGTEETYSAATGDVRIFQVSAGGEETQATYATRAAHVSGGGSQVARLYGGRGRIEPDGSATVSWQGAFSVNFYGGMVPFSIVDPRLTVDAAGNGALTAELRGCASDMLNPDVCSPLPSVAGVTVATFSGVAIAPSEPIEIQPHYAGVEVDAGSGTPQNRVVAGWGAWPQSFVDFQMQTGLSSYWYSSGGGADPYKPPLPIKVVLDGQLPPPPVPAEKQGSSPPASPPPSEPASPAPRPGLRPIAVAKLGGNGVGVVAVARCAGASPCALRAPRRVRVKIGGKAYWARVLAPKRIPAGKRAQVRVKLPRAALKALGKRKATVRVRLRVGSGKSAVQRVARVRLKAG